MAQRVRVHIRYFATTDGSPEGVIALEYLRGLLRIAPVRVLSMSGPGTMLGMWEHYTSCLATPIGATYVNVVCCPPVRWAWRQNIDVPLIRNGVATTEHIAQDLELYTAGVRNVLIMPMSPEGPMQAAAAARYEARVAPRHDIWRDLSEMTRNCMTTIIPVPLSGDNEHRMLREVVLPS